MRPKDLKFPFIGDEPHILLSDRVWYIPDAPSGSSFEFPGWSHPEIFGNNNPICIEYCSGNGAWIADKAAKNPLVNWVAVEMKFDRVRKIWSKVKNLGLNNLLVICGEALNTTTRFFGDSFASHVYINFPDPWPKRRHANHRLIQPKFVQEIWRILQEGKTFTFVTDDVPYSQWLIKVMSTHSGFVSLHPSPYYVNQLSDYGSSYFDELWRAKGREIRYHQYQKINKF